jgi:hypothetical protein
LPALTIANLYKSRWQVELFKPATDSTLCCTLQVCSDDCV